MAAYEPYPTSYNRLSSYPKPGVSSLDDYGLSGLPGSSSSSNNLGAAGKLVIPYSLNSLSGGGPIPNVSSLSVPPLLHSSSMGLPSSVPSSLLHPAMAYQSKYILSIFYLNIVRYFLFIIYSITFHGYALFQHYDIN